MRTVAALALLAVAALAPAAPVPKATKKPDDKTAITGTWTVTDLTISGRNSTATYTTFTFDSDDKVTLRQGKNGGNVSSWTWALDDTTSPKRMTWTTGPGVNNWDVVYEVDGDSLKVGFISKGSAPPAKVEPGDGLTLYVMTREQSK